MSDKTLAIPPGETIKELLEDKLLDIDWLTTFTGMSQEQITSLLEGKIPITPYIAQRLEEALQVPAQFWLNLEAIYQEGLAQNLKEIEHETN